MKIAINQTPKPFTYCHFTPEDAIAVVTDTIRAAADELGFIVPTDLLIDICDMGTKPLRYSKPTSGQFWWPIGLSVLTIKIAVHGGATVANLRHSIRHEVYHLWEWLTGNHPSYNETKADAFALG